MITAERLAQHVDVSASRLRPKRNNVSSGFDRWLAGFWTPFCPPEPDTCPDAVSELDSFGARAIRWYDAENEVLGYVTGQVARCYRVPANAIVLSSDDVLDEDGPVCDGDDHDVRRNLDVPPAAEPQADVCDLSGRDWLPAGDFFHRQSEGERQLFG